MDTNQDKVKALIGMENYMKLAHAGYIAIEIESLERLLAHNQQLQKLEDGLRQLELFHDNEREKPEQTTAPEDMPDIDIDFKSSTPPRVIPHDYKWSTDTAFQTLEDEARAFNTSGTPLYIKPLSVSGRSGNEEGELGIVFMAKGNSKFIELLKQHHWTIHRWRVADKNDPTRHLTQVRANKHVKLRYQMGYEPKLVDIQ